MTRNPWASGDKVRFAHQREGEASYTITAEFYRQGEPMVEIKEMVGEFAAHVFVAADYPDDSIVPRPGGAR